MFINLQHKQLYNCQNKKSRRILEKGNDLGYNDVIEKARKGRKIYANEKKEKFRNKACGL